jgi:hypothetical protein
MRLQISEILKNSKFRAKGAEAKNVFDAILDSDLPPQELTLPRLQHEAATLIGAGVETTNRSLSVASFHISNNPTILYKLQQELENAIPDPKQMPRLEKLEQLPYLSACIEEGEFPPPINAILILGSSVYLTLHTAFRLSYGTSQRAHRVSDSISITYGSYTIPPGTIVSMDNVRIDYQSSLCFFLILFIVCSLA